MILIWTQMVPILPPENRNDQRAMDGLLVQYMTPKMARFVSGCEIRLKRKGDKPPDNKTLKI
ncbi:Uncharacterised protein [Escherichia coli]|nr:Uncharacterised protein [Escherichia coli]